MSKPLRVYIITQEEPFYIPKVVRYILSNQNENFSVVGGTVLKPHRKNKSIKDWILERTKIYTYWELFLVLRMMFWCKFLGSNSHNVKNAFKQSKIKLIDTPDINTVDFIHRVKQLKPDIILSISPPQLFQKELIELPTKYCLNAHGTLLPRHRGVFGSWWTIYNGDKEAGSTIHTIDENVDRGIILWQRSFATNENDTQYSIAYQTKELIAQGSVELLNSIAQSSIQKLEPSYSESYHRAPNKEQGKDFHKKGKHIIISKDIKNVLKKDF